jgi:hypothetical protein
MLAKTNNLIPEPANEWIISPKVFPISHACKGLAKVSVY